MAFPHAGPRQLLGWSPRRSRPPRVGLKRSGFSSDEGFAAVRDWNRTCTQQVRCRRQTAVSLSPLTVLTSPLALGPHLMKGSFIVCWGGGSAWGLVGDESIWQVPPISCWRMGCVTFIPRRRWSRPAGGLGDPATKPPAHRRNGRGTASAGATVHRVLQTNPRGGGRPQTSRSGRCRSSPSPTPLPTPRSVPTSTLWMGRRLRGALLNAPHPDLPRVEHGRPHRRVRGTPGQPAADP